MDLESSTYDQLSRRTANIPTHLYDCLSAYAVLQKTSFLDTPVFVRKIRYLKSAKMKRGLHVQAEMRIVLEMW